MNEEQEDNPLTYNQYYGYSGYDENHNVKKIPVRYQHREYKVKEWWVNAKTNTVDGIVSWYDNSCPHPEGRFDTCLACGSYIGWDIKRVFKGGYNGRPNAKPESK